jgi:hypothetical protein
MDHTSANDSIKSNENPEANPTVPPLNIPRPPATPLETILLNLSAFTEMFHESQPFSVTVGAVFVAAKSDKPFITIEITDDTPELLFDIENITQKKTFLFRRFQPFNTFTDLNSFITSFLQSKETVKQLSIRVPRQSPSHREGVMSGREPNAIGFPLNELRSIVNIDKGFVEALINTSGDTQFNTSNFFLTREFIDPFVANTRLWAVRNSLASNIQEWTALNAYYARKFDFQMEDFVREIYLRDRYIMPLYQPIFTSFRQLERFPFALHFSIHMVMQLISPTFRLDPINYSHIATVAGLNANRTSILTKLFAFTAHSGAFENDLAKIITSLLMPGYVRISIDYNLDGSFSASQNQLLSAIVAKLLFMVSNTSPITTIDAHSVLLTDRIIVRSIRDKESINNIYDHDRPYDGINLQPYRGLFTNANGVGWMNDGINPRIANDFPIDAAMETRPVYGRLRDTPAGCQLDDPVIGDWGVGVSAAHLITRISGVNIGAALIKNFLSFYVRLNEYMRKNYYSTFRLSLERLQEINLPNQDVDIPRLQIDANSLLWFFKHRPADMFTRSIEVKSQLQTEILFSREVEEFASCVRLMDGLTQNLRIQQLFSRTDYLRRVVLTNPTWMLSKWLKTILDSKSSMSPAILAFGVDAAPMNTIDAYITRQITDSFELFLNLRGVSTAFFLGRQDIEYNYDNVQDYVLGEIHATNFLRDEIPDARSISVERLTTLAERRTVKATVRRAILHQFENPLYIQLPYQVVRFFKRDNVDIIPYEFKLDENLDFRTHIKLSSAYPLFYFFIEAERNLHPDDYVHNYLPDGYTGLVRMNNLLDALRFPQLDLALHTARTVRYNCFTKPTAALIPI